MRLFDRVSFPNVCVFNVKTDGGMKLGGSAATHVQNHIHILDNQTIEKLRADHQFVNDWLMEYARCEEERRQLS